MTLKWLFDRIVSVFALIAFAWLLLIIAATIKVKMGGPVLFVQNRVGRNGQLFRIHKFRTMKLNHDGSSVSVAGESRITPLGSFLRKYKLDELPELWDVMVGNMSFVGPRPDVPGYTDKLQGEERNVLKLLPGITGPATLKYRNEETLLATKSNPQQYNDEVIFPDKVRLNLYYYHHYSFLMDLKILFATVFHSHIVYAGEAI